MSTRRSTSPPWPPATLQRMTLLAVIGCVVGIMVALVGVRVGDSRTFGYWATMIALLLAGGLWNLRAHRRLRAGEHWSQRSEPRGGA